MTRALMLDARSDAVERKGAVAAEPTDRELVQAVSARGDEVAFRELYRRHTPRLYQMVLRLLAGSAHDAEDVVQETWLKVATSLDRFRWDSAFATWLTGIGLNQARDFLRRSGRRPVCDGDPDEVLLRVRVAAAKVADRIDLDRAIALLPDGYRTVFVLHDVEGYPHAEIAARMEISEGTSKSQLFHARRALRAVLEPAAGARDG